MKGAPRDQFQVLLGVVALVAHNGEIVTGSDQHVLSNCGSLMALDDDIVDQLYETDLVSFKSSAVSPNSRLLAELSRGGSVVVRHSNIKNGAKIIYFVNYC